ncbi:MAG: hypothetical protein U0973_06745 [Xanthomonadaceae bacterium]|nr:hypothetical protein [Xanthomonadaceae bacterium]
MINSVLWMSGVIVTYNTIDVKQSAGVHAARNTRNLRVQQVMMTIGA